MSKKSTSGNSTMLLLAGLGVGAFMLFANKGKSSSSDLPAAGGDSGGDIPFAPKILAVNSSDSESPTPTGIVSDEEGMEATSSSQPSYSLPSSSSNSNDDNEGGNRGNGSEDNFIPDIISTVLTAKEKDIIDKGLPPPIE